MKTDQYGKNKVKREIRMFQAMGSSINHRQKKVLSQLKDGTLLTEFLYDGSHSLFEVRDKIIC